jgi:hypothetical protein
LSDVLPAHSTMLGNELQMSAPLRRRDLSCIARNRARAGGTMASASGCRAATLA